MPTLIDTYGGSNAIGTTTSGFSNISANSLFPKIITTPDIGEINAIEEMHRRKEIEKLREQTKEERRIEKGIKQAETHTKEVIKKLSQPIENEHF